MQQTSNKAIVVIPASVQRNNGRRGERSLCERETLRNWSDAALHGNKPVYWWIIQTRKILRTANLDKSIVLINVVDIGSVCQSCVLEFCV